MRSVEASLVNARAEYGRATQLLRSRTISRVEFDRAETAYRVAQENFEAARQTLDQSAVGREEDIQAREAEVRGLEGRVVEANLQLADSTLRAPYDGVNAQRFVEQGQNVRAKQPVVKFQDIAEIDIAADIPESVMAEIRSADIVGLVTEFSALPDRRFPVHIKEVAQRADPVTQTFAIRVAMMVPEGVNLLPGMSATVAMTYRRASILGGRILVPIAAIFEAGPGQQSAWVLGLDQTVARRPVKTGGATGGRIESGRNKLEVVREVVAENQWPLFGATAIGVIAFAAIGLSEDRTGEYTNSLFWVILIALSLSWVSSVTATPLLSCLLFKPNVAGGASESRDAYAGPLFQLYRKLLVLALRFRWAVVIVLVLAFVVAGFGFKKVDQSFFPPATRPQFMVDAFLPAGTHIRETEAFAGEIQRYVQGLPGVTHVTSFIGGGGLRFLLVYSPENENRAYVQFLVDVKDPGKIDGLMADIQKRLDENCPNANAIAKKFLLGPGDGGRVQIRFRGPDSKKLRELGDQAMKVLQDDGGALCVRGDWRERVNVIRPGLLEFQARRNGITRVEVARAMGSSFEGRAVGFYREPGSAGAGVFPQETRLLPIVARPPLAERGDVGAINSLQIWSPVAGRMIPLNQVTAGAEVAWEDPVVVRRDRFPTLTVHADPRSGLPSQLRDRVKTKIGQIALPPGYSLEWGGEYEDSARARGALAEPLPYVLALMIFIVVCLFNSVRTTLLIWLIIPLAIIAITAGLLLTRMPFGFMAMLGVLALGGELIKNQIVVLSKILTLISKGTPPYQAILDGGTSMMRPVCMVVLTTVLGMIPLLTDPFFGSMAVCIMFGLSFAAVLSLIVTPVLYAIFFGVEESPENSR